MSNKIGSKVWHAGDEVTITTEPYTLYGGMFQDAIKKDGSTITLATHEQHTKNVNSVRGSWSQQQAEFRSLRNKRRSV